MEGFFNNEKYMRKIATTTRTIRRRKKKKTMISLFIKTKTFQSNKSKKTYEKMGSIKQQIAYSPTAKQTYIRHMYVFINAFYKIHNY